MGRWTVIVGRGGTSATVTERVIDGFELVDAFCFEIQVDPPGGVPVGQLDGNSVSFQMEDQTNYGCQFFNAPDNSTGEIVVSKIIDADGNLDTVDDQTAGEGWEFDLDLLDGTINQGFPVTNSGGFAGWLIKVGPDGTSATLTEVLQEDFEILDASCIKIAESGNEPIGEFDGDSVTFQVEGGEFGTHDCQFFNARVAALATLPPTHAATGSDSLGSDAWRLVLVVLAALIASILLLKSNPAAPSRR